MKKLGRWSENCFFPFHIDSRNYEKEISCRFRSVLIAFEFYEIYWQTLFCEANYEILRIGKINERLNCGKAEQIEKFDVHLLLSFTPLNERKFHTFPTKYFITFFALYSWSSCVRRNQLSITIIDFRTFLPNSSGVFESPK